MFWRVFSQIANVLWRGYSFIFFLENSTFLLISLDFTFDDRRIISFSDDSDEIFKKDLKKEIVLIRTYYCSSFPSISCSEFFNFKFEFEFIESSVLRVTTFSCIVRRVYTINFIYHETTTRVYICVLRMFLWKRNHICLQMTTKIKTRT
jgi:hypothetical protein